MLHFSPAKLKAMMDARGLKAYGAAKLMGVSTTWVQRLLDGGIRMPTDNYLLLLEKAFNVPYTEFLEDTNGTDMESAELTASELNEWMVIIKKLPPEVRRQRIASLRLDVQLVERAAGKHRLNETSADYDPGEEDAKEQ